MRDSFIDLFNALRTYGMLWLKVVCSNIQNLQS